MSTSEPSGQKTGGHSFQQELEKLDDRVIFLTAWFDETPACDLHKRMVLARELADLHSHIFRLRQSSVYQDGLGAR